KNTEKGPGKLEDAFKDSSVAPPLRAQAAAALVDIGRQDEVDQTIASLPEGDRTTVVAALIPLYAAALKDPSVSRARSARDALYSVRAQASPAERAQIDGLLLPAVLADIRAGRLAGGRQPLEKIVQAIGAPAAPALAEALEDPRVPFAG